MAAFLPIDVLSMILAKKKDEKDVTLMMDIKQLKSPFGGGSKIKNKNIRYF